MGHTLLDESISIAQEGHSFFLLIEFYGTLILMDYNSSKVLPSAIIPLENPFLNQNIRCWLVP